MKRSNLQDATELSKQLQEIETHIVKVKDETEHPHNYLGITLQGQYQDKEFVDACRQTVLDELDNRRRSLKNDLIDLGVFED